RGVGVPGLHRTRRAQQRAVPGLPPSRPHGATYLRAAMGDHHTLSPGPEPLQPAKRPFLLLRLRRDTAHSLGVQHVSLPARDRDGGGILIRPNGVRSMSRNLGRAGIALIAIAMSG